MVLAKDEAAAARIKTLGLHGMSADAWKRFSDEGYKHYLVTEAGFKYNMMDLQAAIGLHQLARVERSWERRAEIWAAYNQALAGLPLTLPSPAEPDTRHAYHLYTVLVDPARTGELTRDQFLTAMTGHNIGVGVHYLSLPEHPYYRERFGWRAEDWPEALRIGRATVSLPISPKLSDADVADVAAAVREVLGG
jgi:dTDP-4-amino-4,6-dideoxygalactose transaminase